LLTQKSRESLKGLRKALNGFARDKFGYKYFQLPLQASHEALGRPIKLSRFIET